MTTVVGSTRTVSIVAAAVPAWFSAMGDKEWATPVSNTIADVGTGDSGITNAWTGGCVDQDYKELILAANGGHGDYSGNEVYACQFNQDTPAWVRLTDPSTAQTGDSRNDNGAYSDGSPRSRHGWGHTAWGNGKVWITAQTGMYNGGEQSSAAFMFDRASLGSGPFPVSAAAAPWTALGKVFSTAPSNSSNYSWQSGSAAYDSVNNRVWACCEYTVASPTHAFWSFDGDTGAITTYPSANTPFAGGATLGSSKSMFIDGYWVILAPNRSSVLILDPADPNSGFTEKSTTGSPSGFDGTAGAVYHEASRAILVWDTSYGSTIRKLAVPVDLTGGTWTWSSVAASGGVTPPGSLDGDFQGVRSKFNIINDVGNGQGALVAVCNVTGSTYAYKLPAGGV